MNGGPLDNTREFHRLWATVLLGLGAACSFIGSVVFAFFTAVGGGVWEEWALDQHGVTTQATVQGTTMADVDSRYRRHWHDLAVTFVDAAGVSHQATMARPGTVAPGTALTIDYDPQQPQRIRRHGKSITLFGYFTLIPLAVALLGLPLLVLGALQWRRQRVAA